MESQKYHDVYLGLGTNLGNREENIFRAIKYLNERVGMVLGHSSFYITEPIGFQSDNKFINAACILLTTLSPVQLLEATQEIERDMGRKTKSADKIYADRIIDIDILTYDDMIYESEELVLPHPHLHQRKFVLAPLAEIAGQYIHPLLNKTLDELNDELPD